MRCRNQLHQVLVANLILGQKSDVIRCIASRRWTIFVRNRCDVGFAANDWFYAGATCFLVKFNRPKQIAVIGDRNGRHFEFSRLFHQFFHSNSAVQQRVFGVQMQMNERIAGHQFCSIKRQEYFANLPSI